MARTVTVCVLTDERIYAQVTELRGRRPGAVARGEAPFTLPDSLLVEHDPDELAAAIANAVAQCGCDSPRIDLVLPFNWCFAHVLTMSDKRIAADSLIFEFEQYLPLPLEELTCALQPLGRDRILAAAVPTAPMQELFNALSHRGIDVERVTVDVIAAHKDCVVPEPRARQGRGAAARADAQSGTTPPIHVVSQCEKDSHTSAETLHIAILDARWARLVVDDPLRHDTATATFALCGDEDRATIIARQLEARGFGSALDILPGVARAGCQGQGWACDHGRVLDLAGADTEAAVEAIASAAATRSDFDLRTGSLAARGRWDRPLRLAEQCMACALLLALVWIGGMALRKQSLERQLAAVETARRNVYREVFDTDTLPPGAAMRLASETVRLEGLTRTQSPSSKNPLDVEPTEARSSPIDALRNLVLSLPDDVRIMLLDARLDERQLTLRGQTAGHRDAERIVEAINRVPGLHARPPRTSRLAEGGVEFSILATTEAPHGQDR